jgi:hypothetical protein
MTRIMNRRGPPQEQYKILGLHREVATVQDVVEAANRLGGLLHPSNYENDPSKADASIIAFGMVRSRSEYHSSNSVNEEFRLRQHTTHSWMRVKTTFWSG